MEEWAADPLVLAVAGLAAIIIIMLVWMAVISGRLKKLRKQYVAVMGNTGITNIEDVVIEMKERLAAQERIASDLNVSLLDVEKQIPLKKSKIGVLRYNAFGEQGNDLSFSIAIVNEEKDGVVLSGIHNRENMFIYAKPIEKGSSKYHLTPEEISAISDAK